jgi:aldehyde dehydrogenase (NAD+)
MQHFKMLIGGELVDASDGALLESADPGSGQVVATCPRAGVRDAEQAVEAAAHAFETGTWRGLDPKERARVMMDLADRIQEQAGEIGLLEARDSGGLIRRTIGDVTLGARLIRNWRRSQDEFPWRQELPRAERADVPESSLRAARADRRLRRHRALELPFHDGDAEVTMAAFDGRSVIPQARQRYTAIARAREVGGRVQYPEGVINVISGPAASAQCCARIPTGRQDRLPGSTEVGSEIMSMAAGPHQKGDTRARGKSANIVLPDADTRFGRRRAPFACSALGQVCESGTRLLLPIRSTTASADRLCKRASEIPRRYQLDPKTKMGPLVSKKQLESVANYVSIGRAEGAELVLGGAPVAVEGFSNGCYYAPTIFGQVNNRMRIAQEEIFGPVLSVIRYQDEAEASIANDSPTAWRAASGRRTHEPGASQRRFAPARCGSTTITCSAT